MGKSLERDYYDGLIGEADRKCFAEHERRALYSLACAQLPPFRRLCDLGCGTGPVAGCLAAQGITSERYLGLDFSPRRIEVARELYPGWSFQVADLSLPETKSLFAGFDAFSALELLEHLDDDLGLIASLPAGAFLALSVPNFDDPGHVRWFGDLQQAIKRYAPLVNFKKADVGRNQQGQEWYLLGGVVR